MPFLGLKTMRAAMYLEQALPSRYALSVNRSWTCRVLPLALADEVPWLQSWDGRIPGPAITRMPGHPVAACPR